MMPGNMKDLRNKDKRFVDFNSKKQLINIGNAVDQADSNPPTTARSNTAGFFRVGDLAMAFSPTIYLVLIIEIRIAFIEVLFNSQMGEIL